MITGVLKWIREDASGSGAEPEAVVLESSRGIAEGVVVELEAVIQNPS